MKRTKKWLYSKENSDYFWERRICVLERVCRAFWDSGDVLSDLGDVYMGAKFKIIP